MSCSREQAAAKKESLYFYLKSYKPTIFQQSRDNTPKHKQKFHNQENRNNRRKSCYCSECGAQGQFQYKTQDFPQVKSYHKNKRKQIAISKTQSTLNMEEYSPQCEDSPLIKQPMLSSRKSIRYAIHCRFRKSILCTNSEDKLLALSQQKKQKSSFLHNDYILTLHSKQSSPVRKISQFALGTSKQNNSLKSLTTRSPQYRKYANIYLAPLGKPKKQI